MQSYIEYCVLQAVTVALCVQYGCVQVCVRDCPTANEFGVRDNPVCVDTVNTEQFRNISGDVRTTASNIVVSYSLRTSEVRRSEGHKIATPY